LRVKRKHCFGKAVYKWILDVPICDHDLRVRKFLFDVPRLHPESGVGALENRISDMKGIRMEHLKLHGESLEQANRIKEPGD
jgi:hypothetical protein